MRDDLPVDPRILIAAEDAPAFTVFPGRLDTGLILVCDHAGNTFPEGYGTLGVSEGDLQRHIAYDIGAAAVTRLIAAELGAPATLTRFSRLLIDCNRGADDPTLIMRLADGTPIEGNRHLTQAEHDKRIALYYSPYHAAIAAMIDRALAQGIAPVLLSMHSYTPVWKGTQRPWHAAVLWDRDPRLAGPLLSHLRAEPEFVIGDNEPYKGGLLGDCMWRHGTERGLAHALVEIRQDLISDEAGQREWAARLARIMASILAGTEPGHDLRSQQYYGSDAA
jgi:predicted N-formylglutamate amidohydrolase